LKFHLWVAQYPKAIILNYQVEEKHQSILSFLCLVLVESMFGFDWMIEAVQGRDAKIHEYTTT
jgi:hypothetical protein